MDLESEIKKYDYTFKPEQIAQAPASPRETAKLLIYNRRSDTLQHDTFKHLASYLPKRALLVFNETKVIPARLALKKPTGGIVKILYLSHTPNGKEIIALADRRLEIGMILSCTKTKQFNVTDHIENRYTLKPLFPIKKIYEVFETYGTTPIPPYIKESPLSKRELKQQYQTVFAKSRGSVAAPTASLHFTKKLLADLKRHGIDATFVTLHVGLGTFAPLTAHNLEQKRLHKEWYEISAETARKIEKAKKEKRPVIAVGTTVVRTLEYAWKKKNSKALKGYTDLFIQEGYTFKIVDGIITNFHIPKSSLLMLVAAFAGREKTLELYQAAIKKHYRLFSFGDGMLII